ncbi:MAG: hypothetical protein WBW61_05375 [Rhodanobacteraceae bacterium]
MDRNTLRLRASLLILRLSVALVMLMWTIDKFVRPEHGSRILEHFYGIAGIDNGPIYVMAAAELVVITLFALGLFKTWTYGLILLLHAASTLSSYQQYFHAFERVNLLFFAAWPMLGACVALFLLRDEDRLASLGTHR